MQVEVQTEVSGKHKLRKSEPRTGMKIDQALAKAFQDLIFLQADNLTADDQKGADLDKRPGHIQKSVFNTGVTEDIHYRREGQQLEIAYDMGDGHHAQYLLNDDDKAVYVDMVRSSGHSHDMAVFVDKKNPANSVLFAKED